MGFSQATFFIYFLLKLLHTTYKTNTATLFYISLQFLTLNDDSNTNATLLTQKKKKKTATLLILNNKLHTKREKLFYLRSENSENRKYNVRHTLSSLKISYQESQERR